MSPGFRDRERLANSLAEVLRERAGADSAECLLIEVENEYGTVWAHVSHAPPCVQTECPLKDGA